MKKDVCKVLILSLLICTLSVIFSSCGLLYTSTRIHATVNASGAELTTDMTTDDLRSYLTVYRERSTEIFPLDYKEITDYNISCQFNEGISNITVEYDGVKKVVEGVFFDKNKLSLEGDFLFGELLGVNYLVEYRGDDKNIVFPEREGGYILYDRIFYGNKNIESVSLGNSVTEIGREAFAFSSLKRIDIGSGLASICRGAFNLCRELEYVNVSGVEQWCTMKHGGSIPLYSEDETDYPFGSATVIDLRVDDYHRHAYGAYSATEDNGYICYWKKNGELSESVPIQISNPLYFAKSLYVGGEKLEHLTVPENVTELTGSFQFSDIKSVSIHNNVSHIASAAFMECAQLEKITVEDVNVDIVKYIGNIFDKESNAFTKDGGLYYIGNAENPYMIIMGFYNIDISSVTVPDGVRAIASYAFKYPKKLTEVNLPDSLEYLAPYAIQSLSERLTVTCGSGLLYIGEQNWLGFRGGDLTVILADTENWYLENGNGELVEVEDIISRVDRDKTYIDYFRLPVEDDEEKEAET